MSSTCETGGWSTGAISAPARWAWCSGTRPPVSRPTTPARGARLSPFPRRRRAAVARVARASVAVGEAAGPMATRPSRPSPG
eukprot:14074684-Alexandrium_andersonii.AAC.1